RRIMNLADALVGHMVGGLAQVNVLLATMMAGMTGSSTAEAAMQSRMLVPEMTRKGYDKAFSTAVTACSALIATMIPPSIGLILYGVLANVSIGRLFIAGIVPGLLMGATLMLIVRFISIGRGYRPSRIHRASWGERMMAIRDATWALLIPIGIVLGLRSGVFTPTEAGAVAAIYATLVGAFIYREITWRVLGQAIGETVLLTGIVMMVISAANAFGFYLAWEQVPTRLADAVLEASGNAMIFLLLLNLFLLIAGMFLDGAMMLVLLTPLLIPVIHSFDIDPVHFGIVFMLNLEIGAVTPPLGIVMYTAISTTGVSVEAFSRQALPLFTALIAVLLLITFVPALTLTLPNLLFR
ncbi:MAG TPA: TRAP transporter large permease, partial [Alphaproteobacteria bacterium]|nr:TRAP transporter large permease [Alphaproteobacteria bacterium]